MAEHWYSLTLRDCRLSAGPGEFDVAGDGLLSPDPCDKAASVLRQLPHLYKCIDDTPADVVVPQETTLAPVSFKKGSARRP